MKAVTELALANLLSRRARSAFLVLLLVSGFLCLSLVRASYRDLFAGLEQEQRETEGDILIVLPEASGPVLGQWRDIRSYFLADPRIESMIAQASINGLVGGVEGSAPVSGIAREDTRHLREDRGLKDRVTLGLALAQSLSLKAGDECTGLLNNRLYDLFVEATLATEVLFKDRFWIEAPLSLLMDSEDEQLDTPLYSIAFRVHAEKRPAFEQELKNAIEQDGFINPRIKQLAGSDFFSIGSGNTRANTIMSVYEDNYLMIALAVILVLFLALVNVLMLSCRERRSELGTLCALGARRKDLATLMWIESITISLFASGMGIILSYAITALANRSGGITLPPPPTSTEPMVLNFLLSFRDLSRAILILFIVSLCAPLIPLHWLIKQEAVDLLRGGR